VSIWASKAAVSLPFSGLSMFGSFQFQAPQLRILPIPKISKTAQQPFIKMVAFWLRHQGKMQGDNYQIDKEPILNIPIKTLEKTKPFEILVDEIVYWMTF
jgi:hypothetical protein